MFNLNSQQHATLDQQNHPPPMYNIDKKESDKVNEFPFCYNVSTLPKLQPHMGNQVDRFDTGQPPFSYNYSIVNPMCLTSTSTASFKCEICGQMFAHLSLLNYHKRVHIGEPLADIQLFTCDICNASFTEMCDLKAHKLGVHNIDLLPPEPPKYCEVGCQVSEDNQVAKCDSCDDGGRSSEEELTQDPLAETSQNQIEQKNNFPVKKKLATVAKCVKCNGTGIIIVGKVETDVDKPFRCNICDSTFSRYSSLWSHRRLHSGEKPFKCEMCGLAFARSSSLKNHTRVHTGERPYKCNVCGMQFSQAPHLKNHERIHSGERPYECDICNKTFARHSTLWNHRRIHTGEKPYRCDTCGSAFNQASHLKNHIKVHTGEKPYKCDICEVSFSDRFTLKRHRGIHEKYGQTNQQAKASSNSANPSSVPVNTDGMWKMDQSVPNEQMENIFKCEENSKLEEGNNQQTEISDIYKCNISNNISFPGCSTPTDK